VREWESGPVAQLLSFCVVAILHGCTVAPLRRCAVAPLRDCAVAPSGVVAPLRRCTIALLRRRTVAWLHGCTVASLHRCIAPSLHLCIVHTLPACNHTCTKCGAMQPKLPAHIIDKNRAHTVPNSNAIIFNIQYSHTSTYKVRYIDKPCGAQSSCKTDRK
jgi:hypothetical protein